MIIDSHAHAWGRWPYTDDDPGSNARGRVETLLRQLDENGVERALIVCAGSTPANADNNRYVAEATARYPARLAMAADVDSRWSPDHHTEGAAERLAAVLDATSAAAVSHYCADHDDGWFRGAAGAGFFAVAERRRIIISLHAGPAWYSSLGFVLERHPGLIVLLHHQGHAQTGAELDALCALGRHPGLHVKLSGFHYLGFEGREHPFHRAVDRSQRLLATFGPGRIAWGSDFPVCRHYDLTYRQTLELVDLHCAGLQPAERVLVLGGTVARILGGDR